MRKRKEIWTKSKPSWRRTRSDVKDWDLKVQDLLEDYSVYTALIYCAGSPPWHRDEEEYAYMLGRDYILLAPRGYTLDEQASWRQDHYSDPRVVATWAYNRTAAETAQLKNLEIQEFKNKFGQEFRPSIKGTPKAVIDENVIRQMVQEGATVDEVVKRFKGHKTTIYSMYWRIKYASQ